MSKARHHNAAQMNRRLVRIRQTGRLLDRKIDHEAQDGTGLVPDGKEPDASHLPEPGDRFHRTRHDAPMASLKTGAVVADEAREPTFAAAGPDKLAGKGGFARPGRAADQDAGLLQDNTAGMDRDAISHWPHAPADGR